jgi:hypothetical protein
VTQTRPGSTPLGRTVGLVAPTPAEYRSLGEDGPALSAIRAATGGSEVETPQDPWLHDLQATSRSTDLWPLLLVLALPLWPLDIALRRMSIGRRELVAAGAWVRGLPARRRRVAARTATGESLLGARDRATSAGTRAALRRSVEVPESTLTSAAPPPDVAPTPVQAAPATPAPTPEPTPAPTSEPTGDTMARLRDAKRRARDR